VSQGLIIGLGLLAIAIVVAVMVFFLRHQRLEDKNRIERIIVGKSGQGNAAQQSKDKRRSDLAKKLKQKSESEGKSTAQILRDQLNQAGFIETDIKKYWIYSAVTAGVVVVVLAILKQPPLLILLGSVIGFFGLPKLFLKFKTARRQKKFLEEFADALESMVRLLKAGMPIGEAVAMVSREYEGPVSEEMTRIYEEQKIGVPLAEACINSAKRMPLTEMQMFATGISIQQQTGSSLSEVLLNLAKVIRARFRLKRKVQALSAEAKASAMIIGALPILVAGGLTAVNPEYMEPLYYTLKGKIFLAGAVTWMCIGILIMRQMINFRV
jgi:tight adherence protein B